MRGIVLAVEVKGRIKGVTGFCQDLLTGLVLYNRTTQDVMQLVGLLLLFHLQIELRLLITIIIIITIIIVIIQRQGSETDD